MHHIREDSISELIQELFPVHPCSVPPGAYSGPLRWVYISYQRSACFHSSTQERDSLPGRLRLYDDQWGR